jgi:hypothetical protein
MRLDFSLTLTDDLFGELKEACRGCGCSPAQFAVETLEAALATRGLPGVALGRDGARIELPEEPKPEFTPYPVHWPGKSFDFDGLEPTNEFFDLECLP